MSTVEVLKDEPHHRDLKKVTMQLSPIDVKNTDELQKILHTRSKAAAVSTALAVTAYLTKIIEEGGTVLVRDEDGNVKEMFWPGLSKV